MGDLSLEWAEIFVSYIKKQIREITSQFKRTLSTVFIEIELRYYEHPDWSKTASTEGNKEGMCIIKDINRYKERASALLSYISTWEFLRTREKYGQARAEGECFSHFSSVLKNSQVFIELNHIVYFFY